MGNKICDENCFNCKYKDCILPYRYFHQSRPDIHKVTLTDMDGEEYVFPSKVEASKFLGRSGGYFSNRSMQKKSIATDIKGNVYKVKKGGRGQK